MLLKKIYMLKIANYCWEYIRYNQCSKKKTMFEILDFDVMLAAPFS